MTWQRVSTPEGCIGQQKIDGAGNDGDEDDAMFFSTGNAVPFKPLSLSRS